MTTENSVHEHAVQLAHVMSAICTRTLNHFAEEAKINGESLKDAFERYEIDYAWHVLGSERLREATLACMAQRHSLVATEAQKASLAGILKSAAEAQAPELLMSFDNEVPEKLADSLCAAWAGRPLSPVSVQAA
ncbi:MAG: hypothetical protein KGL73_01640 [Burkholderiales bacterium]|nr:hypothetical protein [Burkholderiales bacterium]